MNEATAIEPTPPPRVRLRSVVICVRLDAAEAAEVAAASESVDVDFDKWIKAAVLTMARRRNRGD